MNEPLDERPSIRVCHVAMGDLWAGAEVQLLALLKYLIRLPRFEWSVVLLNEGRLAHELRKLPLSVTVIPEKHNGPLAITLQLARLFRDIRPNIVHTHKYKDSILGSIVAKYMRVPHVVRVIHGMPEPFQGIKDLKMAGYTFVDQIMTRCFVDRVVTVSKNIQEVLGKLYGINRVVCIHNGIDLENVHVSIHAAARRKELHLEGAETIIGTVGRLVPVKGHTVLIEATRLLLDSGHKVKLLIVGDGPLRDDLEAKVKQQGIENHVCFAGHQDQSYDFIAMMDVFVLPSLHEGIPMVLLEALALGRPVIASRVGGIPEIITVNASGILVSPGDPCELATRIIEVIEKKRHASAFETVGRAVVEREFSASMMAERTAAMYRALCNEMPKRCTPVPTASVSLV